MSVLFRCSDEAYDRIFRRRDERDGGPFRTRGERLDEVVRRFCDELERDHEEGIRLIHPKGEPGRVRRLSLHRDIKARFDVLTATAPVSIELLMREAVFRFTRAC